MPSTQLITIMRLRVDTHDTNVIEQYVKQYVKETILIVKHNGEKGDNPHFHMYAELKQETSMQTLKNQIKKHFNVEKAQYCVEKWDETQADDAYAYVFHEGDDVEFIVNNLSEEQVEKAKARNKEVNSKPKKATVKEKKEKQLSHWQIVEEIRGNIKITDDHKTAWMKMLEGLEKHKIRTGMFCLEKWFVTIQRNRDHDFNRVMYDKIMSKIYS